VFYLRSDTNRVSVRVIWEMNDSGTLRAPFSASYSAINSTVYRMNTTQDHPTPRQVIEPPRVEVLQIFLFIIGPLERCVHNRPKKKDKCTKVESSEDDDDSTQDAVERILAGI
jgi:hypothetical protein